MDVVVCLDELHREISGGDAGDQSATPAAVARQNLLLDCYLAAGVLTSVMSSRTATRSPVSSADGGAGRAFGSRAPCGFSRGSGWRGSGRSAGTRS
ncbi:hypothetical protein WKI68_02610 [Streptomyces sp. MS1.HAVA.3]|uniref:Uncharacterized protein n=1 Tax=Streptomyces caledonius TaxID=3134107 RepID=A0ABU8TYD7_9ACTN